MEERAPRLQNAAQLTQRCVVVHHVLKHLVADYDVDGVIRVRKSVVSRIDRRQMRICSEFDTEVAADDIVSGRATLGNESARATSPIENPRVRVHLYTEIDENIAVQLEEVH